jgi:hypothetical protein
MSNENEIEIYEFSRAFDNIKYSDYHKTWVSGGYSPEKITRCNKDVPSIIREQVSKGYFALNDNYPPEQGEVALIAREIRDKDEHDGDIYYSILAVANRQIDDGDRPTIGYIYFWICTDDKELDGILTLLMWWNEDQPEFKMEDAASRLNPDLKKAVPMYFSYYSKEDWFQSKFADPASQAEYIPYLRVINHQDKEQENEKLHLFKYVLMLHFFSYALSRRVNPPISWAWNVKRLQHPEAFICIYCATKEAKLAISPYRRQISELHNSQENHLEATESEGKSNEPPPIDEIRKCLTDIARNFAGKKELEKRKVEVFFEYLKQYKYSNEDWGQFIDETTRQNSLNNTKITYEALLALVIPERTYPWLSRVIDSVPLPRHFNLMQNWSQEIGILFQREIWCASRQDPDAYSSLRGTVYQAISRLLVEEIIRKNIQENHDQRFKKIRFLLTESKWSKIFKDYADSVWDELTSQEPKPTTEFSTNLYYALQESKTRPNRNYLHIAELCKLIGQEHLSALLYLLCNEDIQQEFPQYICNQIYSVRRQYKHKSPDESLRIKSGREHHSAVTPRQNPVSFMEELFRLVPEHYDIIIICIVIVLFVCLALAILYGIEHWSSITSSIKNFLLKILFHKTLTSSH